MVAKPYRRFVLRFSNLAFFIIISGNTFRAIDGVSQRSELFHCPSEGFHPDPMDCKVFYRCVSWNTNSFRKSSDHSLTAFQFTCAEGTVFDPDLNVCNHPQDTSRAECGGKRMLLNPFMRFSLNDNIDEYLNGDPFLPTNESEYPARQFQGENAYADEYSYGQQENNKYPWQIDEYEDPVRDVIKVTGNCQSEGFFAIEGDCTKFMRCAINGMGGYTMYTFQCGPGTVWDQKNLICNHPYVVPECGGTKGYDGQVMMPPESDYNYDSVWMQPGRDNKKDYNGQNGYAGISVKGTYPGVENQEDRPPVRDYSKPGNYPYHGDHRIYPQQHLQTYSSESTEQEWNANNFQQTNYPVINPVQTNIGNIPYHATYSQAQFQGKYSQAAYYFTGENFNQHPGQNEYQYRPESSGYGQVPSYTPAHNRTNQTVLRKRPNLLPYPEQGTYTGYQGGYQDRPKTPATVQMLHHAAQNRTNQISPTYKPGRPTGQENEEYASQVYENNYPHHKHSSEESEVPSGDAKECHKDGFFSIPGECRRFFRCVDNSKGGYFRYDFNCGEGTVWDQESTTCNYPWAVKRKDVDCSSDGSASESNLNSLYSTSTHQTATRENETRNQTISHTTLSHSTSSPATISSMEDRGKTPQSQNQMRHTTSSQESHHYKPATVEHKTSSYTSLNKETSYDEETTKKQGMTTPMTPHGYQTMNKNRSPEIQYPNENNTHSNKYNNQDGETSPSLSGTTPFKPDEKGSVKCKKAGFYPYPGSCKRFYRCIDWDGDKGERFSVYYFECGAGTIWDPALETCNHEESVYPSRDCQEESHESMEEKRPSSTDESSSVTNESTEVTMTSDYTMTTYSDNKTPHVHTTLNIDTTVYATEESKATTDAEGTSFGSTDSAYAEMATVSSSDEVSSTIATTESIVTTVYDNTITSEHQTLSTTMMTITDEYETIYTTDRQTDTTDRQTDTTDHQTDTTDRQTDTTVHQTDTTVHQTDTTDRQTDTTDRQTDTTVHQTDTTDRQTDTTDRQTDTTDHQTDTTDRQTDTTDHQTDTTDRQTDTTVHQTDTTDHQTDTTDRQTDTTVHQTDITVHQTDTTDRQTDTTVHQTDTTYVSTRETTFMSSQATESMYTSDISTTTEPAFTDAEQERNPTTQNPSEQNYTSEESSPDCPVLKEDQVSYICPTGFRRHPKECNNFYQCTITKEGDVNIMILSCQNNTVYDEEKIQCLPRDETRSCPSKTSAKSRHYRRTEREKISMVPVSPSHSLCPNQGNFPYHGDCQKFFKCRTDKEGKMQGFLYQCPENFSFWEVSKKCELSIKLPKCSRFPQDVSPNKLRWMSSKVPVASLGAEAR